MKFLGKFTLINVYIFLNLIFIPLTVNAYWNIEVVNNNSLSIDTVWGTSTTNVYAISFAGKVFHKGSVAKGDSTSDWTDITSTVFPAVSATEKVYLPYGLWGTGENDIYISGSLIDYSLGDSALTNGTPFVFHYNGTSWTEIKIVISENKFKPNWLAGIWGASSNDMYFSGGQFIHTATASAKIRTSKDTSTTTTTSDPVPSGIILHYNASSTTPWTGEVGIGDFVKKDDKDTSTPYTVQLPMINEITGINDDIFAVGLSGLVLHKTISNSTWSISHVESQSLYFFRVWASNSKDVFACGFNNSTNAAIIYRYNGTSWLSMTIPALREGYIPAIWGIWGESSNWVHSVGNGGTSLYYDGNPLDTWHAMVSDTTTSLNCVWGTSFNNAYAAGENGNIYHFTEGIKTSSLGAYPRTSVAPQSIQFTDLSPGTVDRWEWNFGEGPLESVAPTADLDYKILVTAKDNTVINNGDQITILDNGSKTGTSMQSYDAVSATANLDGKIHITAKPGSFANNYSIMVESSSLASAPAVYRYGSTIFLKVIPDQTTQSTMAALINTQTDIVQSVAADSPDSIWFTGTSASSNTTFKGGQNYTIKVFIDSGVTTQQEIADILVTHPKIASAVPDSPTKTWVRGQEQVSNTAAFSGGLADRNQYANSDTSITDYFKATHTYKNPGTYTTTLKIHRPSIPSTVEFLVNKTQRPDVLTYNQALAVMSVPGSGLNGYSLNILDCGQSCTPSMASDDLSKSITVYVSSGNTKQWELANLVMQHPLVLAAYPSVPTDPWYVDTSSTASPPKFYGGFDSDQNSQYELATLNVLVLKDNPLDFTQSTTTGIDSVNVEFKDNSSSVIKNRIIKWTWYFNYVDQYNPGSSTDGTIVTQTDKNSTVSFQYSKIGTYNVKVIALLDDNSAFELEKDGAVIVKSSDEDRSSSNGGSGLNNFAGCFIGSLL